MLERGQTQYDDASSFITIVATRYASIFNSDRRNPDRTADLTAEDVIDIMTEAMKNDKNFKSQAAKVRIPFIRIPNECPEEKDLYDDLKDMKADLQEITDLSNYMLNPKYGIAEDPFKYWYCPDQLDQPWKVDYC